MTPFQILLFSIIVFIMIFIIIDRICRCFENCATSKAYGMCVSKMSEETIKKFLEGVK